MIEAGTYMFLETTFLSFIIIPQRKLIFGLESLSHQIVLGSNCASYLCSGLVRSYWKRTNGSTASKERKGKETVTLSAAR